MPSLLNVVTILIYMVYIVLEREIERYLMVQRTVVCSYGSLLTNTLPGSHYLTAYVHHRSLLPMSMVY